MTKPTEEILLTDSKEIDARRIACHVREIIKLVGEDPESRGLAQDSGALRKGL